MWKKKSDPSEIDLGTRPAKILKDIPWFCSAKNATPWLFFLEMDSVDGKDRHTAIKLRLHTVTK